MSSDEVTPQSTNEILPAAQDASDVASTQRVLELRKNNPGKSTDALVEILVRNRCLQVAGVGAATAGAAAIPGVGAVASVAVGSMVDLDSTHKVQSELVLDIATIYAYQFAPGEKQRFVYIALGLDAGGSKSAVNSATEQLIVKGGQQLARKATQRIASKSVGRVIPVVGVATSAGSNILTTYAASQRAKAYIQTGPDSVGDIETSIRSSLGMAEMKLSDWTFESVSASISNLSDATLKGFDQGAQKAGRAAGKFVKFLRKAATPKS